VKSNGMKSILNFMRIGQLAQKLQRGSLPTDQQIASERTSTQWMVQTLTGYEATENSDTDVGVPPAGRTSLLYSVPSFTRTRRGGLPCCSAIDWHTKNCKQGIREKKRENRM
jgi:hypothetical protein